MAKQSKVKALAVAVKAAVMGQADIRALLTDAQATQAKADQDVIAAGTLLGEAGKIPDGQTTADKAKVAEASKLYQKAVKAAEAARIRCDEPTNAVIPDSRKLGRA